MRHKIKGIVIRETPKGETSKLLTVVTSSLGVITVNAKGVRKLSSPYLKSAQLFAFSDMLLYEKNGFFTLSEASLIADFYPIREDIKKYSLACYLADVASSFSIPGDDSGIILRILLNSLYALENDKNSSRIIKAAFELRICAECGFLPEVSVCEICGEELDGEEITFNITEGVSYCKNCAFNNGNDLFLTRSVVKAILHITESELTKFISFKISEKDEEFLSACAERFLLSRAERGFKTLSFYKHCEELP
ncbi:MAG: DNA repair protein RecO [Clostridia bacterium]|nr:DNA repair protein RecO [Clostridia bacterium]